MKRESFTERLRAWLNHIPIQDPIERRIAVLFQTFLIGLIFLIIFATLALMASHSLSVLEKSNAALSDLFGLLVVALPLSLLRRGYFRASVLIIILILFITPTLAITVVFDLPNSSGILFQFTLAILLAGLLVSRRALALTFGLSAVVVGFSALREPNAALHLATASMALAGNFILFNGLIALLIDRFGVTLRASEKNFFKAFLVSPDSISISALDTGEFLNVNEKFVQLFGYSRAEVIGHTVYDLNLYVNIADREHIAEQARAKGYMRNMEVLMRRKSGETLVSQISAETVELDGRLCLIGVVHDITERKQAEEKLREAEASYHALVENTLEGMGRSTLDGKMLAANPALVRLNGYDTEAELISAVNDISMEWYVDINRRAEFLRFLTETGEVRNFESEIYRHKTRERIWISESARLVRDANGEPLWLEATIQDITARKQAEQALRESDERYRQFIQQTTEAIYLYDVHTRQVLDANPAFLNLLGYTRAEAIQLTLYDIVAHSPENIDGYYDHLIKQGSIVIGERKWRRKNGTLVDVDVTVSQVPQNGRAQAFVLAHDITERKRAEAALRESESKYRLLFENMKEGFSLHEIILDENGKAIDFRFLDANKAYEQHSGFKPEAVIGRTMREILPQVDPRQIENYGKVALTGEPQVIEYFSKAFGRYLRVRAFSTERGRFATIFEDISDRKKAEMALQVSEERYRNLFNTMEEGVAINEVVFDENGNATDYVILDVNPAFEKHSPYKIEEALGNRATQLYQMTPEFISEWWQAHSQKERAAQIEYYHEPSGRWFFITTTLPENGRFATLFIDITVRKQVEEKLLRQNERLKALREIDTAILSADSVESIAYVALDHIRALIQCQRSGLALIDWEKNEAVNFEVRTDQATSLPKGASISLTSIQETIQILLQNQPILVNDLTSLPDPPLQIQAIIKEGMRAACILPLFSQSQLIGSFSMSSETPGFFDEEKISLGREVANQIAIAITQSNLLNATKQSEEKLLRQNQRLKVLREIDTAILSSDSVATIVRVALDHIRELIDCRRASITLIDWETNTAEIFDVHTASETSIPSGTRVLLAHFEDMLQTLSKDQPVLINDLSTLKKPSPQFQNFIKDGLRSLCVLPLFSRSSLIGVFSMSSEVTGFFDEQQMSLGREVANQVAIAITQNRLIEALNQLNADLERLVEERTAALAQANTLLQTMLDYTPDHIFFKDLQSRFIKNSKSQADMLGLSDPAEVVGKTDFDFFPHAQRAYDDEQSIIKSGKPMVDFEEHVIWPDGRETWVAATKVPLRDQAGTIIGTFGVARDITDRKHAEEALRKAKDELEIRVAERTTEVKKTNELLRIELVERKQIEKEREALIAELTAKNAELERFTYTVSHDLKSPLVTMKGFLGYLEQDLLNGNAERLKGDMRRIASAVDRMQELLNDLLKLSRIGRFVNESEFIPFADLAEAAIELVDGRLKEHSVTVQLQPNLPMVHGDRQRLTEVLQNLLDNAAKYMGDQVEPQIEIGQRGMEAGMSILYVKDNGIGIPAEYHERIFGLFNKLDSQSEGTGIGLALVKRIIEYHGGRIWVESEAGKGTTFLFTLPDQESETQPKN